MNMHAVDYYILNVLKKMSIIYEVIQDYFAMNTI